MSENIAEWEENREFALKSTSAANRDVMIDYRSESLYFILQNVLENYNLIKIFERSGVRLFIF